MMEILVWALKNWRALVAVALLAMAFAFGRSTGASSVQSQWDSEKLKMQQEAAERAAEQAKKILDLETTKNENEKRIDGLLANNHALWLRLPKTPCPKPADTSVGQPTTPGAGPLYTIAPDPLEGYSREVGNLLGQCDKIVESCRVNAEYLQSLKQR